MTTRSKATIEDLYRPNRASVAIVLRLKEYERTAQSGRAYTDNAGFRVRLPHRESFSPDAAYYVGPRTGGKFLEGAPIFAAEVRSESDFGETAERALAEKRADYFAAGTAVVWDMDVLRDELVRVYRATDPGNPRLYQRGESAEAEPALPGFRMPVDELFE